jgi:hypothetical protein
MLRSRSKRPTSWGCGRSDLPMSEYSKRPLLRKHRSSEPTSSHCIRPVSWVSRHLKALLVFLVLFLALIVVLYVWVPAGERRAQVFTSRTFKARPNLAVGLLSKSHREPLLRGKPPVVERSILEKLALMDQTADDPDERPASSLRRKYAWPPAVTRIPEPEPPSLPSNLVHHQFQNEHISTASSAEFDLSICGAESCRFILPLRIAEQESKARLHFIQILELATSLNRIVVLPNVGKSRMGTCFKWSFDKYYDTKALQVRPDNGTMRIIDMETFRRWSATRRVKPNAQIVSIDSKPLSGLSSFGSVLFSNGITVKAENDQDPSDPKHTRCLKSKFPRLDLDSFASLSIHPSKALKNKPFGIRIVDALLTEDIRKASFRTTDMASDRLSEFIHLQEQGKNQMDQHHADLESYSEPDVLILNYDLRHPAYAISHILASPNPTLSYSPALIALAAKILSPLEPANYLVIHWRMETVPPEVLPKCAQSLVNTIADLFRPQELGEMAAIKTVWFASDYPYPISRSLPPNANQYLTQQDGGSKSGTFRDVGFQHAEAIEILRSAFEEGGVHEGTRITGLAETLAEVKEHQLRGAAGKGGHVGVGIEGELMEDSGVLGILDKIIGTRAGLFVSGGDVCGRVRYVCYVMSFFETYGFLSVHSRSRL